MGRFQDAVEGLRTEVAETQSAIDSALVLINGFVSRLGEALMSEDLAGEIDELRLELDAASTKLATAVAENTAAAEDSDDNYDPTPVGESHEEEDVTLEPEPSTGGGDESSEQPVFEDRDGSMDASGDYVTGISDAGNQTDSTAEASSSDEAGAESGEGEEEAPPAA